MKRSRPFAVVVVALALSACAPKLTYVPPAAEAAPAFKENAGWKPGQPNDAAVRGAWWEAFGDPRLNELEARIIVSNQTLKAVEAQFAQAVQAVRATRAAMYPQVGTNPAIGRFQQSVNRATPGLQNSYADFILPGFVSYEADAWGRIRNATAASLANAQASAADLETVRVSVHSELAVDYLALRGLDNERRLLDSAVEAFSRALELTTNRFKGGLASGADVAQAETQLETTRAQATEIGVQRAVLEHAIAVLVGQPASTFSIPMNPLDLQPPVVPAGLPSELLERRPDIAASERRVAAANAQVGVATSAFYPVLALTAAGGFESRSLTEWLASASSFWSVGAQLAYTAFDGGRRRAIKAQALAAYEQSMDLYQQSVLVAFREVEDQLSTLRTLDEEATVQQRAVAAAERSLALATNRYRGGVASYLEVITAQNAALTNQRVAATLLTRRLTSTVLLVKALGGGWDANATPKVIASGPDQHQHPR